MYITRLALDDFRSWQHVVLDCTPGITVLYGANGLGKTNLVEAIEVLATGSSHRAHSTLPLVRAGMTKATVRANIAQDNQPEPKQTTYEITLATKGANRARINGGRSLYMRDIVGNIPVVTFAPDDQRLVTQDPSLRRSFVNQAGTLLDPDYYSLLQQYTQVAKQRAALLKTLQQSDNQAQIASTLQNLEIWTAQFIELGVQLTQSRARIINMLSTPFTTIYQQLAAGDTSAAITYTPSFEEVLASDELATIKANISEHFRRIYAGEVARAVNLIGPHRDDFAINLHRLAAKEYASNGEAWTLALALKMALCEVIEQHSGKQPIIILDDVFAQLDMSRREQIMQFAQHKTQVFITMAALRDVPDAMQATMVDVEQLAKDANAQDDMMQLVAAMVGRKQEQQ